MKRRNIRPVLLSNSTMPPIANPPNAMEAARTARRRAAPPATRSALTRAARDESADRLARNVNSSGNEHSEMKAANQVPAASIITPAATPGSEPTNPT